jgi:hypothetical protein
MKELENNEVRMTVRKNYRAVAQAGSLSENGRRAGILRNLWCLQQSKR